MYDGLTARYTFPCPMQAEVRVRLSAFRTIERLPGASRPSIYEIRFACPCGAEHAGLATQGDLDWAPLGQDSAAFYNVNDGSPRAGRRPARRRGRVEDRARSLALDVLLRRRGPPTGRLYPSAFRQLVPESGRIVVAIVCPVCARTSANLVSHDHLDIPF